MTDSNVPSDPSANLPQAGGLSPEAVALMEGAAQTKDFKQEDLLIPFLLIVQSTSAFIVRGDADYIAEARPGDIIDTLTRDPRQKVAFIPVKFEITYSEWKPSRGGLVKQWGTDASRYDACGSDFGTRKTPEGNDVVPAATYYGLIVFEDGATMPVIIRMTGSQYKKSRRLNTLINMVEVKKPDGTVFTPPMFSRFYALETVQESNDLGNWFGWKIEPGAMVFSVAGGASLFEKANRLRKQIDEGTARAAPINNPAVQRTIDTDAQTGDQIPF